MEKISISELTGVAETSLITMYARAKETGSKEPILRDESAVEMVERIDCDFVRLTKGTREHDRVFCVLRTKRLDDYVRDFLARNTEGVVVSIGCGLDNRFSRIDNQHVTFYDLDFPQVIAVRRKLLTESKRNHFIASSALDFAWMDQIESLGQRPFLFIAEGVFQYFSEEEAQRLLQQLQKRFPGSEAVFDVYSAFAVKLMSRHGGLKNVGASIRWGIRDSRDIETLCPGAKFLDDWHYCDKWERKLGLFNLLGRLPLFGSMAWAVHYLL